MQLQLTNIPGTTQRLLIETADTLATRDTKNYNQLARTASVVLQLTATAHRHNDVTAIDDMHSAALRAHWKAQQAAHWATSRSSAEMTATTRHATALAEKHLAGTRQDLDEITELVVAAAQAVETDVAAGLAALGDIAGLTEGQVIDRMYEIGGVTSAPREPVVRKTEQLPLKVGSPLPGGAVVVAKQDTGGSAWAITDSDGVEWRISKYAELLRYPLGQIDLITPDWAGYGS
ncbi:hypothetical protein [Streptomyces decoyicus]